MSVSLTSVSAYPSNHSRKLFATTGTKNTTGVAVQALCPTTGTGSLTVSQALLKTGAHFRLRSTGSFDSAAALLLVNMGLKIGSTVVGLCDDTSVEAFSDTMSYDLDLLVTVKTEGSSGVVVCSGILRLEIPSDFACKTVVVRDAAATVDISGAVQFLPFIELSDADAGHIFHHVQTTLEFLGTA